MAMASSSSPLKKYDVFISYRGLDTRVGFTSHLHSALSRNYFRTYIDDRIKSGNNIWEELVNAIKKSTLLLVVFSENYANSTWCLDELVEMMECSRNNRQVVVLPVFYRIEPSQVRYLTGSYGTALAKHKTRRRYSDRCIQNWRNALFKAASLSGFHVTDHRTESAWIEDINISVLKMLDFKYRNELTFNFKFDENYCKIQSSIDFNSTEVQIIGIWGAKGIGKTALAEAMYQRVSCNYEGSCFLAKVTEESKRNGINFTYNKLLSKLLNENLDIDTPNVMSRMVMRKLRRMKAFIVLDDVRSSENLQTLIGERRGWLGAGSIVIVTTRDKSVLTNGGITNIHKVKKKNSQNSLGISYLNFFNIVLPKEGFLQLTKKAIDYAKCNPLALKALKLFHQHYTSDINWNCALAKLMNISNARILRWSYKFKIWGRGQVWALFHAYRSMKVMFGNSVKLIEQ